MKDYSAYKILQVYHSMMLMHHVPLQVIGDGNYLFRVISKVYMANNVTTCICDCLLSKRLQKNPDYCNMKSNECNEVCNDICLVHRETATPGAWAEILVILAVSLASGVEISSYYPPTAN